MPPPQSLIRGAIHPLHSLVISPPDLLISHSPSLSPPSPSLLTTSPHTHCLPIHQPASKAIFTSLLPAATALPPQTTSS
ncbi:hypothetical protein E2C01_005554 [Portunus trituberculatus]|uniref:Uncharacterized protein n=1 Tax=Portunus trituberculatus TaxID=210409 RepID=A0A5B7CVE5_PORTR|nr:hypothetical protein [Portunus trituberculatus]